MIAKIIKGTIFSGVLSYMLNKREGQVKVLQANGVRSSFPNDIAHDFNLQASMRPNVQNQFVIPYSHSRHMIQNDCQMQQW